MDASFMTSWHFFLQEYAKSSLGIISEIANQKLIIMSKLSLKPLADRVLIEPAAAETTTSSGIIIPDTAKEKPQRGTVVAVGAGTPDNPVTLKVGDQVLYGKYAGTELNHEGTDYLIMKESDVFAII